MLSSSSSVRYLKCRSTFLVCFNSSIHCLFFRNTANVFNKEEAGVASVHHKHFQPESHVKFHKTGGESPGVLRKMG